MQTQCRHAMGIWTITQRFVPLPAIGPMMTNHGQGVFARANSDASTSSRRPARAAPLPRTSSARTPRAPRQPRRDGIRMTPSTIRFSPTIPPNPPISRAEGKSASSRAARRSPLSLRSQIWPGPRKVGAAKNPGPFNPPDAHWRCDQSALRRIAEKCRFKRTTDLLRDFPMSERTGDENLVVRIPTELREAIERAAAAQHRTLSGQTRYLLASAIEAQALRPAHREV
jgi:hypothetical protein